MLRKAGIFIALTLVVWGAIYAYNYCHFLSGKSDPFYSVSVDYLRQKGEDFDGKTLMVTGKVSIAFEATYMQAPQYPLSTQFSEERLHLLGFDSKSEEDLKLHGKIVSIIGTYKHEPSVLYFGKLTEFENVTVVTSDDR